jgi:formylglycine-generating enzyme required for sulfatase activity
MRKLRFFLGAALIGALLVAGCDDPVKGGDPADKPGTEDPGTDKPGTEDPGTEDPGTEDPAVPEGFALVEGGTFTMGSPEDEADRGSDEVQHSVTVGSFYLGKYEVTQKEWEGLMGTGLEEQMDLAGYSSLYGEGDDYPMYYVSWLDAVRYCNARSDAEGLAKVYTIAGGAGAETVTCDWEADGYRLPTEAEWEYAATGGGAGFLYSGSDTADDVAWYWDNSDSTAHPVGGKAANGLGIYDMSGNLWEWCWDWYGDYGEAGQTDPRGPESGSIRVCRGGSWSDGAGYLRSSLRGGDVPSSRYEVLGFRLARSW